jgi:hypothetical protein
MDAIEVLKNDHRKVEQLFADFLASDSDLEQEEIFQQIQTELTAHAEAEEKVFYPRLREVAAADVEEAIEEHAEAKQLLMNMLDMDFEDEGFEVAFMQLMESVQHHVTEEESPDGLMESARRSLDAATLSDMAEEIRRIKESVQDDLAA